MVALSQKEGGTLSLMSGSVCSQFGPHAQFWVRVGFFSSFFFFFLCFFLFGFFFYFSTNKLRSRTGAVVFSPSARQLPPVVN